MSELMQQAVWKMNSIRTGPRGGTPVVFVHPAGWDLTYWSGQIATLHREYDVVAFDLPGHGLTPGSPADWTLDNAALMLAQVIQSTGAPSAHIVGLSVGSVIAQSLVVRFPQLVHTLTLMGAAPVFSEAGRKAMLERSRLLKEQGMRPVIQPAMQRWFSQETRDNRPDIVDRATKTLLADDALVHAALWDMMYHFDVRAQLPAVSCPTLIVTGSLDESTTPEQAQDLHELIPGSEISILPGLSHMLTLEAPEQSNELLRSFLSRHEPRKP